MAPAARPLVAVQPVEGDTGNKGDSVLRASIRPDVLRAPIRPDEVQSVVKPITREVKRRKLKKNPLKSINTLLKLNPYAATARRMALLAEAQRVEAKNEKLEKKMSPISAEEKAKIRAAGKAWYKTMVSDSDYTEFKTFSKWLGVAH